MLQNSSGTFVGENSGASYVNGGCSGYDTNGQYTATNLNGTQLMNIHNQNCTHTTNQSVSSNNNFCP
jgi:hypothetical protein